MPILGYFVESKGMLSVMLLGQHKPRPVWEGASRSLGKVCFDAKKMQSFHIHLVILIISKMKDHILAQPKSNLVYMVLKLIGIDVIFVIVLTTALKPF